MKVSELSTSINIYLYFTCGANEHFVNLNTSSVKKALLFQAHDIYQCFYNNKKARQN